MLDFNPYLTLTASTAAIPSTIRLETRSSIAGWRSWASERGWGSESFESVLFLDSCSEGGNIGSTLFFIVLCHICIL